MDTTIMELGERGEQRRPWYIGCDRLQFILGPRDKRGRLIGKKFHTDTEHMRRWIDRESGILLTEDARAFLDSLPPHYREWLADNKQCVTQPEAAQIRALEMDQGNAPSIHTPETTFSPTNVPDDGRSESSDRSMATTSAWMNTRNTSRPEREANTEDEKP